MKAFELAYALLRIPKLFLTLIFIPLILSLLVVGGQLFMTAAIIRSGAAAEGSATDRVDTKNHMASVLREVIFGTSEPLPQIKVCRWILQEKNGVMKETWPSADCAPDHLDVALRTDNPDAGDPKIYVDAFQGNTYRLHLCRTCKPDVVISRDDAGLRTDTHSVFGALILQLTHSNDDIRQHYMEAAKSQDALDSLLGSIYLNTLGHTHSTKLSGAATSGLIILNVASLVVLALWLALKAHRRVLDYFARNGALLPMVAATGKQSFYSALWIITLCRVGAFLLAAIPASLLVFRALLNGSTSTGLELSPKFVALWLLALGSSFALATLIASVSDLKQRHHVFSFLYTYAPLLICFVGAALWAITFIFNGEAVGYIRMIESSIPVFGMVPIIVAPLFTPPSYILIVHTGLTILLLVYLLRTNAKWFGAHLEEL